MFTVTKSKRQALAIDSRKCIDCKACVVACRAENAVPLGKSRNWLNQELKGDWPRFGQACAMSPAGARGTIAKCPRRCQGIREANLLRLFVASKYARESPPALGAGWDVRIAQMGDVKKYQKERFFSPTVFLTLVHR